MSKTPLTIRQRIYKIVYESDTRAGRLFDKVLIGAIILSLLTVLLDSIEFAEVEYQSTLHLLEWIFTILFTFEYLLRVYSSDKPWKYMTSFLGIIDLLSILPTYLTFFFAGSQYLITIRTMRLIRIFRIFKLAPYLHAADFLMEALREARPKITVFLIAVLGIVVIMGTLMYQIEGPEHGFTSIPKGIYWAIVTLTTVGFGDIVPKTPLGQFLASVVMIAGYGIIAIPTGILTSELSNAHKRNKKNSTRTCIKCFLEIHDNDAKFCKHCGARLKVNEPR